MAKIQNIPSPEGIKDSLTRMIIQIIKSRLDTINGILGDTGDRHVSINDLLNAGVITQEQAEKLKRT